MWRRTARRDAPCPCRGVAAGYESLVLVLLSVLALLPTVLAMLAVFAFGIVVHDFLDVRRMPVHVDRLGGLRNGRGTHQERGDEGERSNSHITLADYSGGVQVTALWQILAR